MVQNVIVPEWMLVGLVTTAVVFGLLMVLLQYLTWLAVRDMHDDVLLDDDDEAEVTQ